MFCEESSGKIKESLNLELFRNVSVHEFYRLKALITLEQVNITECSKKKKKEYQLAKLRWSGVVNFHCMQMILVMSMRFIFGDDRNEVPCKSLF